MEIKYETFSVQQNYHTDPFDRYLMTTMMTSVRVPEGTKLSDISPIVVASLDAAFYAAYPAMTPKNVQQSAPTPPPASSPITPIEEVPKIKLSKAERDAAFKELQRQEMRKCTSLEVLRKNFKVPAHTYKEELLPTYQEMETKLSQLK